MKFLFPLGGTSQTKTNENQPSSSHYPKSFVRNLTDASSTPITTLIFLPFFRGLNLITAYEYLELRFDRKLRLLASALFLTRLHRMRNIRTIRRDWFAKDIGQMEPIRMRLFLRTILSAKSKRGSPNCQHRLG